jgi:hypothetical protein
MTWKNFASYMRQPTTLFATAIAGGTAVATWFGIVPEGASVALLVTTIPLLVSDNSGALTDTALLSTVVHALATHRDIGPTAIQVIEKAAPTLLAESGPLAGVAALAAITPQSAVTSASSSGATALRCAAMALLLGGTLNLAACASNAVVEQQQAVYALGKSYDAAAVLAVDYEHNPAADPTVVTKVKSAFQTAHDQISPLMTAAEKGSPIDQATLTAAQDAMSALSALLPAQTQVTQ